MFLLSCDGGKIKDKNESKSGHPAFSNPLIIPYTEAINAEPDNASAYFNRSKAFENINQDSLALKDLLKALSIQDNNMDYMLGLGYLYSKMNSYNNALLYYEKAYKLSPENEKIQLALLQTYINAEQAAKAKEWLDILSNKYPNNPDILLAQADYKLLTKDTTTALSILEKSVQLNPTHYDLLFAYASLMYNNNNPSVLKLYEQLYQLDTLDVYPLERTGDYYLKNNDIEKATNYYIECIMKDNSYEMAYLKLGDIYYNKKDYEKALKHYQLAIMAEPSLIDAYYSTGLAYEALKNVDSAIKYYSITTNFDKKHKGAIGRLITLKKK